MDNKIDTEAFSYTYCAKDQEEIKRIRQKYLPKEPDKMELLRRLDRSCTQKGTTLALVVGILGTLILGVGMSCTMVWAENWFIPGIVIGLVGIAAVVAAYPLYVVTTKKERQRIAPEILRLTDELMK